MGNGILNRAGSANGCKIGDIMLSTENSLGEKWVLCNGDPISGGGISPELISKLTNPMNSNSWQTMNYSNTYTKIIYDKVNCIYYGIYYGISTSKLNIKVYKLTSNSETLISSKQYSNGYDATKADCFGSGYSQIKDVIYNTYIDKILFISDATADADTNMYLTSVDPLNGEFSLYKTISIYETGAFVEDAISMYTGTPYPKKVWSFDNIIVWYGETSNYSIYLPDYHDSACIMMYNIKDNTIKCIYDEFKLSYDRADDGGEGYSNDIYSICEYAAVAESLNYFCIFMSEREYNNIDYYTYEYSNYYEKIIYINKNTLSVEQNTIEYYYNSIDYNYYQSRKPCISCTNYDNDEFCFAFTYSNYDSNVAICNTGYFFPVDNLSSYSSVHIGDDAAYYLLINILSYGDKCYAYMSDQDHNCYIKEDTLDNIISDGTYLNGRIRLTQAIPMTLYQYGGQIYNNQMPLITCGYDEDGTVLGFTSFSPSLPTINKDGINGFIKIKN